MEYILSLMAKEYVKLKSQEELDKLLDYRTALREGGVEGSVEKYIHDNQEMILVKLEAMGIQIKPFDPKHDELASYIIDRTDMGLKIGSEKYGCLTMSVNKGFYDSAMQYSVKQNVE